MSDPMSISNCETVNEQLFHYIWRFQYFNRSQLFTADGERLEIIFPGIWNQHQGPDFKDARIRIGNTILAGNIELHVLTSDWIKHGHDQDRNYQNLILHVVYRHDVLANDIPVLELEPHISRLLLSRYQSMMNATTFIPCCTTITHVRELTWVSWKERLLAERLTRKSEYILGFLKENNAHWEEAFWWLIARNFGMKVNADAFEAIARSIPLTVMAKQKGQIHHLEGLLLGQANLLDQTFNEEYPKLLKREYEFLRKKYTLTPVPYQVHFLRMRPGNFPTVRLAQLAMLIHQSSHLFSRILEADDIADIRKWMSVTTNDYWHYHYLLDEESSFKMKVVGDSMVENIIINSLAPAVFAYGLYHQEEKFKTKAIFWLEKLKAEKNSIINGFASLGISCSNAYDSQALIELKNEYCNQKRCLECSIGNFYLSESGLRKT